jgi:hypothetical protein
MQFACLPPVAPVYIPPVMVMFTSTCHILSNAYITPFPMFPHFLNPHQVAITYGEVTLACMLPYMLSCVF